MKLKDINTIDAIDAINEMTMRMDSISGTLDDLFPHMQEDFKNAKLYGKLNQRDIYLLDNYKGSKIYGIKENDNLIALIQIVDNTTLDNDYNEIKVMYCDKEYRNKGLVSTLLWFIKNEEHKPLINHGVISLDGIEFFKNLYNTKRFKIHWLNINNGKVENNFLKFGGKINVSNKTDWRIIIEGDKDSLNFMNDNPLLEKIVTLFNDIGP